MTRLARTRLSRTVITVAVGGIIIGAFAEWEHHRGHKTAAMTPAPMMTAAAKPTAAAHTATPPVANGIALYASGPQQTPTAPIPAIDPPVPAPATVAATKVLADAKVKANANDLLGARKLLNDALVAGHLSDADQSAVKKQLADVQSVLLFSGHSYAGDPLCQTIKIAPGDKLSTLAKQHAVTYDLLLQINHMTDPRKLRAGQPLKVINGPFAAVVTKGKFTIDLYLGGPGGPGSTYVRSFPVGLGENNSTPTGTWVIENKVPHPPYDAPAGRDSAHFAPDDPQNPIGVYWMGLQGTDGAAVGSQSYGIHGTIDPNSIGKQSSEGCIRLRNDDVLALAKYLVERKSIIKVVD